MKKILIVDDDATTRAALGRLLRRAGAEVVTAGDGGEALQHLLATRFDVLMTDLHMPGPAADPETVMDGFRLLDECARLPLEHRPRRTIAISGEYDRRMLRDLSRSPQSVDFIPKPVDLNQLLDTIGGQPN
ncbi:MAG: response regulator [Planctomycetota bacterium]